MQEERYLFPIPPVLHEELKDVEQQECTEEHTTLPYHQTLLCNASAGVVV